MGRNENSPGLHQCSKLSYLSNHDHDFALEFHNDEVCWTSIWFSRNRLESVSGGTPVRNADSLVPMSSENFCRLIPGPFMIDTIELLMLLQSQKLAPMISYRPVKPQG